MPEEQIAMTKEKIDEMVEKSIKKGREFEQNEMAKTYPPHSRGITQIKVKEGKDYSLARFIRAKALSRGAGYDPEYAHLRNRPVKEILGEFNKKNGVHYENLF